VVEGARLENGATAARMSVVGRPLPEAENEN
jgi:hypothetical protein